MKEFSKDRRRKDGLNSVCKACHKIYITNWQRTHAGKISHLNSVRLFKYGITTEEYESLFERQGGVCRICKQPPSTRSLDVDHDHNNTGVVRGLLCNQCNQALGLLKDDPTILRTAIDYLNESLPLK